jgi:hypothetical protein
MCGPLLVQGRREMSSENAEPDVVLDLREAVAYYSDTESPPIGYLLRYTFGEPKVLPESHPLWEQMKLIAAGRNLKLNRRVLSFQDKSFTQYEMSWEGDLKILADEAEATTTLVEDCMARMELQPSMTFGFIGPQYEPSEDDVF